MRVVSGIAGGRKLKEPEGDMIRPTTDQVKESIFNIIQFDIEGRRVLDLFAGTGQLGIEALSRGAKSAVFVDENKTAIALVRENLKRTGLEERASVVQAESINFLRRCGKFDLILLDPPYDTFLLEKALEMIEQFDILTEGGIIISESRVDSTEIELKAPYVLRKNYRYGKIRISVYSRGSDI